MLLALPLLRRLQRPEEKPSVELTLICRPSERIRDSLFKGYGSQHPETAEAADRDFTSTSVTSRLHCDDETACSSTKNDSLVDRRIASGCLSEEREGDTDPGKGRGSN